MSQSRAPDSVDVFSLHSSAPAANLVVVSITGQADLHSAPALRSELARAIDEGATTVVVDLSGATFIDSMMLGVLLGAVKRLRPMGGQLRIVVDDPHIQRVFELTLLDRVFLLFAALDDALQRV